MAIEMLPVDDVEYDPDYVPRQSIDLDDTVQRYREALIADPGFEFPAAIVVVRTTGRGARYLIIDGVHRYVAYNQAERRRIPASIEHLPESKWFARAVELNAQHGRPLTQIDRSRIVERLGKEGWSAEKIAGLLKVRVSTIEPFLIGDEQIQKTTLHAPKRLSRGSYRPPERSEALSVPVVDSLGHVVERAKQPGSFELATLDAAIRLLETRTVDPSNADVKKRLERLAALAEECLSATEIT